MPKRPAFPAIFTDQPPAGQWTRDEAIAVMCRGLAYVLEEFGREGDAEAVRWAEHVLRQAPLLTVTDEMARLQLENEELRTEITRLSELFQSISGGKLGGPDRGCGP